MKILIASDIHGSYYYTERLIRRCYDESAEKLILLGDIYNYGPRNPHPEGLAPMRVAEMLNLQKENIIVLKGNCDSEVDQMISEFTFLDSMCLMTGDKTVFLTHGHVFNKDNMPKTKFDAMIYGHFHTGFIERVGETLVANTGSVSLPKNDTPSSYIILEDGQITLKDIDGKVIKTEKI